MASRHVVRILFSVLMISFAIVMIFWLADMPKGQEPPIAEAENPPSVADPQPEPKKPSMEPDLTVETFVEWTENAWATLNFYRQDDVAKLFFHWQESVHGNSDDPDDIQTISVEGSTIYLYDDQGRDPILSRDDFIIVVYHFNQNGVLDFAIARSKKYEYEFPDHDFVKFFDSDSDGEFDVVIIGETLSPRNWRKLASLERDADNEAAFAKMDALAKIIKEDSNYAERYKKWQDYWFF